MTEEFEIAWLAGLIEGEGTLSLSLWTRDDKRAPKVAPVVKLYNTDALLIKKATEILGRLGVGFYLSEREQKDMLKPDGSGHYKSASSMYTLTINKFSESQKVLQALRPYLFGEKAARADLILDFIAKRFAKFALNGGNTRTPIDHDDLVPVVAFYKLTNPNRTKGMHPSTARLLNEHEQPREAIA